MVDKTKAYTSGLEADAARLAVQRGEIVALFQPIEALQTGECKGFEALARLVVGEHRFLPDQFLPLLDTDDRLCLFGAMLGASIALLKTQTWSRSDLYVSVNVEISLLVSDPFVDVLQYFLERFDFEGERLVLEMLESEDVPDLDRLHAAIAAVRKLGLSVALDDIGSAYASLTKIKALPIDIVKLDRYFSRDLERRPEDLMFVTSMLSLARGLDKRMIVEGIETPEVYDALRIIGVELGQGYGIARPMPASDVPGWLDSRIVREPDRLPRCLFGAYASHLLVMESCRILRRQPLPIAWTPAAADHRTCVVGRLFEVRGWQDTTFGIAHRRFHEVLPLYDQDPDIWMRGADGFRSSLAAAMQTPGVWHRCDPVEPIPETEGCACDQPSDVARNTPSQKTPPRKKVRRASAA